MLLFVCGVLIQDKIRKTKLKNYADENYNNPKKMVKTRLKNNDGIYITEEQHEKMKKTCLKKFGYDSIFKSKEMRSQWKHAQAPYIYNGIYFDSMPELAYYIWLTDNGLKFEYHPFLPDLVYEAIRVQHLYCPDFIVKGKLVEIKGDHFFEDKDPSKKMICPYNRDNDETMEAKHQYMLKIGVTIVTSREYQQYIDYVEQKYGRHYLKSFKKIKKAS